MTEPKFELPDLSGLPEKLNDILVGGNHLATVLIEKLGPGFSVKYPPTTPPNEVLHALGATTAANVWYAWAAIMRARNGVSSIPSMVKEIERLRLLNVEAEAQLDSALNLAQEQGDAKAKLRSRLAAAEEERDTVRTDSFDRIQDLGDENDRLRAEVERLKLRSECGFCDKPFGKFGGICASCHGRALRSRNAELEAALKAYVDWWNDGTSGGKIDEIEDKARALLSQEKP